MSADIGDPAVEPGQLCAALPVASGPFHKRDRSRQRAAARATRYPVGTDSRRVRSPSRPRSPLSANVAPRHRHRPANPLVPRWALGRRTSTRTLASRRVPLRRRDRQRPCPPGTDEAFDTAGALVRATVPITGP